MSSHDVDGTSISLADLLSRPQKPIPSEKRFVTQVRRERTAVIAPTPRTPSTDVLQELNSRCNSTRTPKHSYPGNLFPQKRTRQKSSQKKNNQPATFCTNGRVPPPEKPLAIAAFTVRPSRINRNPFLHATMDGWDTQDREVTPRSASACAPCSGLPSHNKKRKTRQTQIPRACCRRRRNTNNGDYHKIPLFPSKQLTKTLQGRSRNNTHPIGKH